MYTEMIVIPPTLQFEEYFTNTANRIWDDYVRREAQGSELMKEEHRTLVISCDVAMENETLPVKLHYRFVKDILYCFVEEVVV